MGNTERKIKREIKVLSKERPRGRDEDGRRIIHMTVDDDSHFLSRFSAGDTPVISSEVAEFIEDCTCSVLPKTALTLKIHSACIDKGEQEIYKRAIKEHYTEQYISIKRELKKNKLLSIIMALFGIAILALSLSLIISLTIPFGVKQSISLHGYLFGKRYILPLFRIRICG